jgi:hypothetical protein
MPEQRTPEQATEEIQAKIARGEAPDDDDREFLERDACSSTPIGTSARPPT